jgi:hypothetical protein
MLAGLVPADPRTMRGNEDAKRWQEIVAMSGFATR